MQLALTYDAPKDLSHSEQRVRLMRMLLAAYHRGEYVTNVDCIQAGLSNFRSRFSEMRTDLRKQGWTISYGEYARKGLYKYMLMKLEA